MAAKKIYNLNLWHTKKNYGANLTAYALQQVINSLGYDSQLVNNRVTVARFSPSFYYAFWRKYLKLTSRTTIDLNSLNDSSDTFMTGSDQVFRYIYQGEHLTEYMLDFVKPENKKIAFSASFGVGKENFLEETPVEIIEKMKTSLKGFDFVSVREKSGVEICRDILGVDAEWIIDPVFVTEKENYEALIKSADRDYSGKIVSYVLDKDAAYKDACSWLKNKYKTDLLELAGSKVSVENWLSAIKNCRLVLTDSFHGVCFAIIFNKPFICLANKSRGFARFESIFEMLGIEDNSISSFDEIMKRDCVFNVDYEQVNRKIDIEARRGIEFLQKAIEAPVKINYEKILTRRDFLEIEVAKLQNEATLKFQLKKVNWCIIYILPVYVTKYIWKLIIYKWKQTIGFFKRY